MKAALNINRLNVRFDTPDGEVVAVKDFSVNINQGETLAIVGESGSGKTQTFLSIMGLLANNGQSSGTATLGNADLLAMSPAELDHYRGSRITMVFQDPMTALNPSMRISSQLTETLIKHKNLNKKQAKQAALIMLEKVGIPEADKRINAYPHELSGGMRQRVMIAMALLCEPDVLIADEPTTALDVTIQAQILDLFADLKEEFNTALVLITHDLGVVAGLAERVLVMYAGQVVEEGDVHTIFASPLHPYTQALLASTPRVDRDGVDIQPIPGQPPNLQRLPPGCAFAARCSLANDHCHSQQPSLKQYDHGPTMHRAACFHSDKLMKEKK
ncbi:MAG: ABC transporter ATP-binding protein [Thiolinea sp.]